MSEKYLLLFILSVVVGTFLLELNIVFDNGNGTYMNVNTRFWKL